MNDTSDVAAEAGNKAIPVSAGKKQVSILRDANGRILKGCSLNPSGVKEGSGRVQKIVKQITDVEVENLMLFVLAKANEGDMTAAKLILDRRLPVRKGARLELKLPELVDIKAISQARLHAMELTSAGQISVEECAQTMEILSANQKMIIEEQLLPRIEKLEQINGIKNE